MAAEILKPIEGEKTQAHTVYLAEEPIITLPTFLRLFLHQRAGNLAPDFRVFTKVVSVKRGKGIAEGGFLGVFPLRRRHPQFKQDIQDTIASIYSGKLLKPEQDTENDLWFYRRLFSYADLYQNFIMGNLEINIRQNLQKCRFSPVLHGLLIGINLGHYGDAQTVCQKVLAVLDYLRKNKLDPLRLQAEDVSPFGEYLDPDDLTAWTSKIEEGLHQRLTLEEFPEGDGDHLVTFPKLLKDKQGRLRPGETRIEGLAQIRLYRERIRSLENNRVSIVIVGPPNSGKSTLAVSLVRGIQNFIETLKTKPELVDLSLNCEIVDLDRWTPDASRILGGDHPRKATPWTADLATQTAHEFLGRETNIIIADAPGGKPTEVGDVTKTVIAPADCAIIITNDWNAQKEWREVVKGVGIRPIVFIQSRPSGQIDEETGIEITSTVTTFDRRDLAISGRIAGLQRQLKQEDPFLETAVPILLLHLLPQILSEKKRKAQKLLELLKRGYL